MVTKRSDDYGIHDTPSGVKMIRIPAYAFEELSPEQSDLAKEYSHQFMTALETAEAKPAKEVS